MVLFTSAITDKRPAFLACLLCLCCLDSVIVAKCLSALDFLPLLPFLQPNSDNALHMTLWLNRCFAKFAIKSRIFQKEKNTRKILKFFIGPFLRQISKRKKTRFSSRSWSKFGRKERILVIRMGSDIFIVIPITVGRYCFVEMSVIEPSMKSRHKVK